MFLTRVWQILIDFLELLELLEQYSYQKLLGMTNMDPSLGHTVKPWVWRFTVARQSIFLINSTNFFKQVGNLTCPLKYVRVSRCQSQFLKSVKCDQWNTADAQWWVLNPQKLWKNTYMSSCITNIVLWKQHPLPSLNFHVDSKQSCRICMNNLGCLFIHN